MVLKNKVNNVASLTMREAVSFYWCSVAEAYSRWLALTLVRTDIFATSLISCHPIYGSENMQNNFQMLKLPLRPDLQVALTCTAVHVIAI